MQSLAKVWFLSVLLLFNVFQSIQLTLFLLFRKKTALATLCFILLLSISLLLVVDQRIEEQIREQLQLQKSQIQHGQVEQELFFWLELSKQVQSPHVWIRVAELQYWLGQTEEAEISANKARALDPQIVAPTVD